MVVPSFTPLWSSANTCVPSIRQLRHVCCTHETHLNAVPELRAWQSLSQLTYLQLGHLVVSLEADFIVRMTAVTPLFPSLRTLVLAQTCTGLRMGSPDSAAFLVQHLLQQQDRPVEFVFAGATPTVGDTWSTTLYAHTLRAKLATSTLHTWLPRFADLRTVFVESWNADVDLLRFVTRAAAAGVHEVELHGVSLDSQQTPTGALLLGTPTGLRLSRLSVHAYLDSSFTPSGKGAYASFLFVLGRCCFARLATHVEWCARLPPGPRLLPRHELLWQNVVHGKGRVKVQAEQRMLRVQLVPETTRCQSV